MNNLKQITSESGLDKARSQILLDSFSDYFQIAEDWTKKADALVITSVEQKAEMKMADEGRKYVKSVLVKIEKTRKDLKDDSLKEGRAIDNAARTLKELFEPIRDKLTEKAEYAERIEEERKAKIRAVRIAECEPYREYVTPGLDLACLSEDQYQAILGSAKTLRQAKIDAEIKAENERLAKIEEERKQREAIEAENKRLKAEAEKREKQIIAEKAKAEAIRIEAEKEATKERQKLEAERRAAENARLEAEALAAKKLAAAQAEKKKLEAEREELEATLRKQKAEEAKRTADAQEAEKKRLQAIKDEADRISKLKDSDVYDNFLADCISRVPDLPSDYAKNRAKTIKETLLSVMVGAATEIEL
jgi:DNA repair exonuclease SbcCD ATPase subunit